MQDAFWDSHLPPLGHDCECDAKSAPITDQECQPIEEKWFSLWEVSHKQAFSVEKVLAEAPLKNIHNVVNVCLQNGDDFFGFQQTLQARLAATSEGLLGCPMSCVRAGHKA